MIDMSQYLLSPAITHMVSEEGKTFLRASRIVKIIVSISAHQLLISSVLFGLHIFNLSSPLGIC